MMDSNEFEAGIRYTTPYKQLETCFVTSAMIGRKSIRDSQDYFVKPFSPIVWILCKFISIIFL